MVEALLGFGAIFVLALLRIPLAFAMAIVGVVGLGLNRSWPAAFASAAQVVQETGFAYTLSVIPLFILMGNFVARAGLAHELFAYWPCSRRPRSRNDCCLCWVWGYLWLVNSDSSHHEQSGLSVDA
jgi:TRAP-type mannitol/chloroaromatic compound transport system permease large subunit